jgi:hypothetical protein
MLVCRQDVAQAAIERALLIDRRTARRFVDELYRLCANPIAMRIEGGEERELPLCRLSAVEQASP